MTLAHLVDPGHEGGHLVGAPIDLAGAAPAQVAAFVARVDQVSKRHPEAAAYQGGDVL